MKLRECHPTELVPCHPRYAAILKKWLGEPATIRNNPVQQRPLKELKVRMRKMGSDLSNKKKTDFQWFVQSGNQIVATVSLNKISWEMGYGEIGYMVGKDFQKQGIGFKAASLLVDLVFTDTSLFKLQAFVAEANLPSQRIMKKLGFKKEGFLRKHYLIRGKRVNELVFGLLRPEWKKVYERRSN